MARIFLNLIKLINSDVQEIQQGLDTKKKKKVPDQNCTMKIPMNFFITSNREKILKALKKKIRYVEAQR